MEMILLLVVMFAIMYFLMIRPQQKKMRQHQEMQAQLAVGERVLLTSGIFATVVHVGERQLIVELAPGAEITVLKGNVARRVTPEDEEFEFTDDSAPAVDAVVADELVADPYPLETVDGPTGYEAPSPYDTPADQTPAPTTAQEAADDWEPSGWQPDGDPSSRGLGDDESRPEGTK